MSLTSFRGKALACLAVFCLGSSALTVPALSATFSVGGGTITTSQADASADNTSSGGGFELQANTTAANDAVAVNGVVISGASGRALDVGGQLASSGSYSVTMQGSSLMGGAGAWFQSVGGLISLDTTGGAANTMSGVEGLTVTNGSGNGGVALKLGADTITSTSEAIQAIGQGTGTISIDMAGTTVSSTGSYGIVAQNGLGNITIGGLNGGISGTINATSGIGILTGNIGNQSITLASAGVINAATGISVQGNTVNLDSFGTINASGDAITALNGTGPTLTVTLESSSVTMGAIVGGNANNTFNIVAGANISNATFDGGTGTTTLNLTGSGNGTFDVSSAANISNFQKTGSGVWTLIGTSSSNAAWTIASGTLEVGNGGTSGNLGTGLIYDNGTLVFDHSDPVSVTVPINGSGMVIQTGGGTLTFATSQYYTGATVINSSTTLKLSGAGDIRSSALIDNGTFDITAISPATTNVVGLSGAGTVTLGAKTLTITGTGAFSGVISGSGGVTVTVVGNETFTGINTYSGGTTISAGTLQTTGSGTLGAASGGVTVSGGTLDLGDTTQSQNGGVTLTGGTIQNGTLTSSGTFNLQNGTVTAMLTGSGTVIKTTPGTVVLAGTNTYTGDTTVTGGTLQIGNGGTTGTITGSGLIIDNGVLAFDHSDTVTVSNNISATGSLTQAGVGTLILTGYNTYAGATSVSAGTLNVTGSIASSSVSVAGGATLTGTGKVGTTTITTGGTLTPGAGGTPGTLTMVSNLTLASGSNFSDAITPSAAGLASVSGTASINGNAIANFASGSYAGNQQYTLITAAGGVSGTFSSFATTGLPGSLRASLSYDANDVYLNLKPNALAPSLAGNITTNQRNVVAAIDAAVSSGAAVPSGGFNALYGLSGASLNSAIDQISGRIGPNVSNAVGQSFLSFLAMTAEGGAGDAGNFAPGSAYGAASAPHRAQLDAGQTRLWGAAYGGHAGLSGDAASGAAALSASNVGLIGGADMQVADGILAGVTLGWGRQHFNSGNGSGISTDFAFGLYGRADAGAAYVTAAFGYGWHQIATLRVVTVSGTDVLQGKQNADDYGGRIEAGWRMSLDDTYTIAPYGAFAGESFESPAYAETALSGASTFALSYAAHTSTLGRSELGAHLDRDYDFGNGALTADVRAAWAHQLDDLPFTQANFENLATASFQVLGVRPTRDTALLGADLELRYASGLFLGLKGEGQFGAGTTIIEGMGRVGLHW
jgi:autotransporter-associated beta strand protein